MNAIVAVDKNWGIGKNNDLLFSLKKDMSYFREHTLNKIVVMGSNTLKSFPNSKPLPKRTNIVLYPDGEQRNDCIVVNSMEELFVELLKYNSEDIFIIGGAMFYRTMLDYCRKVYVTKVDADGEAQVFFENLDDRAGWKLVEQQPSIEDNGYAISFCVYQNDNVKEWKTDN